MTCKSYKLALEGGVYGPGDIAEITIIDDGNVAGPRAPNWQAEYLLALCVTPTTYHGERLKYLVLSPRYKGVDLSDIRREGGVVAVGRILSDQWDSTSKQFEASQVEYWAVGKLSLLEE